MDIYEKIRDRVAELTPQLTAWRRELHRFPEPAWREIRTCSIIAAHLESLGYEVIAGQPVFDADARMGLPGADILDEAYERAIRQGADPKWAAQFRGGFTGVIGILHCGEGPTVAMRFDIDGLLLQETENANHFPNIHGFRSENEGVMHACGHDAHIVFGMGTARILAEMKENLHGTVKLIFQPAEEGVQGARAIVAKGHLDDVNFLLGSHVTEQDGFGSDVILEACARTVLATDKHRFEYADKILSSWKQENVHHKADIISLDNHYQKQRSTASKQPSNRFNQFSQNTYDFEALEKELLSN